MNKKGANYLKLYRIRAGMSQTQLSEAIGFVQTWVSLVESGKAKAGKRFWEKVQEVLKLSDEELENCMKG